MKDVFDFLPAIAYSLIVPNGLYHREIYMPHAVSHIGRTAIPLRITEHAEKAAREDRYGIIVIPDRIIFEGKDVVEAEEANGKIVKLVIRLPYDGKRDAIYVVTSDRTLKTVWSNLKSDTHTTLRRNLYLPAPK